MREGCGWPGPLTSRTSRTGSEIRLQEAALEKESRHPQTEALSTQDHHEMILYSSSQDSQVLTKEYKTYFKIYKGQSGVGHTHHSKV